MSDFKGVVLGEEIHEKTELFRYITFTQFVSLIETGSIYLTNINVWDDPWEAALEKLPTIHDNGEIRYPAYSIYEDLYGQCWSINGESDALWRIYSPNKEGILIKTSAEKFKLIKDIRFALLDKVKYTKDFKNINTTRPHDSGLIKREAFEHEQEVRLITVIYDIKEYAIKNSSERPSHIKIKINPLEFIENIIIDPRAKPWFVETVQEYCKRANFSFIPQQSKLYSNNIFETLKLCRTWIPCE